MSLQELQEKAAALSSDDRRKLAAWLTALRLKESGEWERAFTTPAGEGPDWIPLEEAKRRLLSQED